MSEQDVLIEVDHVYFSYGNTHVLDDVTLKVHRGDFLALLGPNGSGKTTLIKIILGLMQPESGKILLMGVDQKNFRHWEKIGYVPQKATQLDPLFPASVREVVAMGILPHKRFPQFLKRSDEMLIDEALRMVDMKDHKSRHIGALSGGQQQRVFIARALASEPSVLVLDEPTTGVDMGTQIQFYDLLDHINVEKGITMILVTHDIGVVTQHVNKVACLNQKLIFHGSHEEFCNSQQAVSLFGPETHLICHRH